MNEIVSAEKIKKLTQPILQKGFSFEYFYQKGGDSSCVYICRFSKGKDFFDWREVSGADDIRIVVCISGEYRFPSLKKLQPKAFRKFALKHIFKKADVDEKRAFIAALLNDMAQGDELFGISLK